MDNTEKNLRRIYSKLSKMDQIILSNYIDRESERIVKDLANDTDYCIASALIEGFPELNKKELRAIIDRGLEFKKDLHEKGIALRKKYGKKVEEEMEKVSVELSDCIHDLLDSGVTNQAKALKILKSKFEEIPQGTLVHAYKDIKESYKGKEETSNTVIVANEEKALDIAAEYIVSDKKPLSKREETEKAPLNKVAQEFKILNRMLELEGAFDKYKVDNDKLIVKSIEYTSLEDIEETYGSKIKAIAKELEIAKNRLAEAKKVFNEFVKQ